MLRRILLLMICCSLCGFAQNKHPFTFEDMMQLKRIGEPSVSPDGKWVAFSAEYAGNVDVYVVASEGGEPKRLTWHPGADVVQGWTPDGKSVVFASARATFWF